MIRKLSSILTGLAFLLQTSLPPLAGSAPSFAAVQDSVPAYPLTSKEAVQLQCNQLAESPDDPQKVGSGVPLEQIKVNEALPVCQQAATRQAWRSGGQCFQFLPVLGFTCC